MRRSTGTGRTGRSRAHPVAPEVRAGEPRQHHVALDVGVLERVDVDRQAVGVLGVRTSRPVVGRQTKAPVSLPSPVGGASGLVGAGDPDLLLDREARGGTACRNTADQVVGAASRLTSSSPVWRAAVEAAERRVGTQARLAPPRPGSPAVQRRPCDHDSRRVAGRTATGRGSHGRVTAIGTVSGRVRAAGGARGTGQAGPGALADHPGGRWRSRRSARAQARPVATSRSRLAGASTCRRRASRSVAPDAARACVDSAGRSAASRRASRPAARRRTTSSCVPRHDDRGTAR